MSVASEQFHYVRRLVRERSAIVLAEDKAYLVESRLAPIARSLGLADASGVVNELRTSQDKKLEQQVVEALTTNETSWFRDKRPFEALRHHIIPEVLQRNSQTRTLRIWSAACSSGQELYSVAMLLDEAFPQLHHGWRVELIGSDINSEMVRRATAGLFFPIDMNRGLPASLMVRHFTQEGACWRVNAALRERAQFLEVNLVQPWPALPTFDIVLLRNVLIYFEPGTKGQVLSRVARQMAPRGCLLLGAAETTTGLCEDFEVATADGAAFYRLKRG
jgi:chemotaxis protein methyltransferase CheR